MRQLFLDAITCSCIVGIHPWERQNLQPLHIDCCLRWPLAHSSHGGDEPLWDYSQLVEEILFITECGRYHWIESLAQDLCHLLLRPRLHDLPCQEVEVTVKKPQALGGRALPSVKFRMPQRQVTFQAHNTPTVKGWQWQTNGHRRFSSYELQAASTVTLDQPGDYLLPNPGYGWQLTPGKIRSTDGQQSRFCLGEKESVILQASTCPLEILHLQNLKNLE